MKRTTATTLVCAVWLVGCSAAVPPPGDDAGMAGDASATGDASAAGDAATPPTTDVAVVPVGADGGPAAGRYDAVRSLLNRSCGVSAYCHAYYDASPSSTTPVDAIYRALVNRPSSRLPGALLVAPGRPEQSVLMQAVAHTIREMPGCATTPSGCDWYMPPDNVGHRLTEEELGLVRDWIAAGAPGPDAPTGG